MYICVYKKNRSVNVRGGGIPAEEPGSWEAGRPRSRGNPEKEAKEAARSLARERASQPISRLDGKRITKKKEKRNKNKRHGSPERSQLR